MKEDYTSFAKEVDRALKEMEERIYLALGEKVEEQKLSIEKKFSDMRNTNMFSST